MPQYKLDIPQRDPEMPWIEVESFGSREAAIAHAQEHYGADEEGRISLISEVGIDDPDLESPLISPLISPREFLEAQKSSLEGNVFRVAIIETDEYDSTMGNLLTLEIESSEGTIDCTYPTESSDEEAAQKIKEQFESMLKEWGFTVISAWEDTLCDYPGCDAIVLNPAPEHTVSMPNDVLMKFCGAEHRAQWLHDIQP